MWTFCQTWYSKNGEAFKLQNAYCLLEQKVDWDISDYNFP